VKIDPEFKTLIPPLSSDEYAQLEENILAEGCREPFVVWEEEDILLDGHNRLEICGKHNMEYKTKALSLPSRDHAKVWIINNQLGKRNVSDLWKVELAQIKRETLLELGREKYKATVGRPNKLVSTVDTNLPKHSTRSEIAKEVGKSTSTVARADYVRTNAPEVWKKALQEPEAPAIGKLYADVKREQKRTEVVAKLEDEKTKEAKAIQGVYDVIVIDPPWEMEKIERDVAPEQVEFDYHRMNEGELSALHIPTAENCHIWVWTTHKHLPLCLRLIEIWGLKYVCAFVWHKPGGFQPYDLPQYNCEFAIYARKGSPKFIDTKAFFTCFNAPRTKHSEKPENFYETIRRTTAGRRLDMFNRRKIQGFDGWGTESV